MASHQRRSRSEWQSLLSDFASSDLTVKAFCSTHSLSQASFYQWRQRLSSSGSLQTDTSPFIDVSALVADTPGAVASWQIELDLGDGLTLRLKR